MTAVAVSALPLPLLHRGKVRDVYAVGADRLLLVATDRVSAFDVVMAETVPYKGAVLTQLTAWWLERLQDSVAHHLLAADPASIIAEVPALSGHREAVAGRAMLCRRTRVHPVECVVRGYLAGSAWKEYREHGTLAGEPLPPGLRESDRLVPPIFSPATKAQIGHDENITRTRLAALVGREMAAELEHASRTIYDRASGIAAQRGLIIADTKFEFGATLEGQTLLIDEALTPDSSRFWNASAYEPGRAQASFDKQPLRDWLDAERRAGRWNGEAPGPVVPAHVIDAMSERYLAAFERLTGAPLHQVLT